MAQPTLEAHRVTKPIQLLAAWLIGLILIDGSFLTSATLIHKPTWITPLLTIAAIVNVPLFLICLFFLQTKFRPEMQEDTFYSEYLKTRKETGSRIDMISELNSMRTDVSELQKKTIAVIENIQNEFSHRTTQVIENIGADKMEKSVNNKLQEAEDSIVNKLTTLKTMADWSDYTVCINSKLPTYKQIRERLILNNIPIGTIFGNASLDMFCLAIGSGVPYDKVLVIFRLIYDLGLEAIRFTEQVHVNYKRIYIGSYANTHNIIFLNKNIIVKLLDDKTAAEYLKTIDTNS